MIRHWLFAQCFSVLCLHDDGSDGWGGGDVLVADCGASGVRLYQHNSIDTVGLTHKIRAIAGHEF